MNLLRPVVKVYHRSQVRGLDNTPAGRCLLVSNHSGGLTTPDFAVFAVDFYEHFGYGRPLYVLAHDSFFHGPAADFLALMREVRAGVRAAAGVELQPEIVALGREWKELL